MATQPSNFPRWAQLSSNDPVTGAPNKQQPSSEFQETGLLREEPLLRDHINWQFNNIDLWIEYLTSVTSTIVVDTTIYVDTAGNDTTGDGTLLNPFASPHKALESLNGVPISSDTTVTILCNAGEYTFTTPIVVIHPYGERIKILGAPLVTSMLVGATTADWSSDRNNPVVAPRTALQLYNTSGTLPANANAATRLSAIQADLVSNKALAKNTFATIFNFTACSGVRVRGNNSLGKLDRILFVGDWAGSELDVETYYGLDLGEAITLGVGTPTNVTGGSILIGSSTMFIGWKGDGISCKYGGIATCEDGVVCANNLTIGFAATFSGIIIANTSISQGNLVHGYLAGSASLLRVAYSISTGNGAIGYSGNSGGVLRLNDAYSTGNGNSGVSINIGCTAALDGLQTRGNLGSGVGMSIGCSADGDTVIASDNNSNGVAIDGSFYDGQNITVENNGGIGLSAQNNSSANIASSTIQNNVGAEVYALRNSSVNVTTSTIPSGSTVTAEKNSYISIPNIAGVTYTPAYATVSSTQAMINT